MVPATEGPQTKTKSEHKKLRSKPVTCTDLRYRGGSLFEFPDYAELSYGQHYQQDTQRHHQWSHDGDLAAKHLCVHCTRIQVTTPVNNQHTPVCALQKDTSYNTCQQPVSFTNNAMHVTSKTPNWLDTAWQHAIVADVSDQNDPLPFKTCICVDNDLSRRVNPNLLE